MQVRCPRCQDVIEAPPYMARLSCGRCGYNDANPLYAPPSSPAPPPFPPPGYIPGTYAAPVPMPGLVSPGAKSAETTALVFGIVSLVGGFMMALPFFLGIFAIVYGNKAKQLGGNGTPGLVMGWISISLAIVGLLLVALFFMIFGAWGAG